MLEYTLTVDDLAAFAAWQATVSGEEDTRRARVRATGAFLVGGAAYLLAFSVSALPLLLAARWQAAGIAEVVAVLAGAGAGGEEWLRGRAGRRLLTRRYRARARAALARTGGARRSWVDPDGLNVTGGERATHVPWAEITGVAETAAHVFVLTGPNAAHILPRRAGAEAVDALLDGVRSRVGR